MKYIPGIIREVDDGSVVIKNQGSVIVATNYWQSEMAHAGRVCCSTNAGYVRILLPPNCYDDMPKMLAAEYCILSHVLHPDHPIEIMFEDHSQSPYGIQLTIDSFHRYRLPGALLASPREASIRKQPWRVSVWVEKDGQPHQALDRACYWRRVDQIPCLRPWGKEAKDPDEAQ